MRMEQGVLESMPAKDDLMASGKFVDSVENLIPGILRHQADERIEADDGLLIQMIENGDAEGVGGSMLPLCSVNSRM
jgi:hypothetical protein